jgi:hypothetical protein
MADPLPPERFAALLLSAGVTLPAAELEDIRLAHGHLQEMLATLREPLSPLAAEPAFTFAPQDPAR